MTDYTALITGGNKGIGAGLASHLLNQGYTVVSMAQHPPEFTHKKPAIHLSRSVGTRSGGYGCGRYCKLSQDYTSRS